MRRAAFILALLLIFAAQFSLDAQTSGKPYYTEAQANQTINNATSYVNMINQSGYLIFSPDLKQAYSYLNQSRVALNSSPSNAVSYANLAVGSANSAYQKIGAYREISLLAVSIFTIIVGLILYRFMKPVKGRR